MVDPTRAADRRWLRSQVREYRGLYPKYRLYAATLRKVLEAEARRLAPQAIVQVRAKSIASFAEKALRKREKYRDPVDQLTDLCGARVIARTVGEVKAFSRFIEEGFDVDFANSEDASKRLQPKEFGYRSIHYIVSFKPGMRYRGLRVPESLYPLKAEIQVRTMPEHAWADFGHDLGYKGAFELPTESMRELHLIAAELEDIDRAFSRFEESLGMFGSRYGAYLPRERIPDEIATLEMVLDSDPADSEVAWRIGKLAMQVESWSKAVAVLSRYASSRDAGPTLQPILRDLGIALCKRHRRDRSGPEFRRGQRYLERSIEMAPDDVDALASYAGTWRGVDEEKAREFYRRAYEVDPTDYYPLGNFLEYEIRRTGTSSILSLLRPSIEAAIARCRAQAEVGMNLPWAHFGIGKLSLLLGRPNESLRAYAKAVRASTASFMIKGSLQSLDALSVVREELVGHDWARRLLLLGLATTFGSAEAEQSVRQLASRGYGDIGGPVVIVVGGTHPSVQPKMQSYRELMLEAFRDFRGTIISGGTLQGVSGLVGEVGDTFRDRIRTIGYLPLGLPDDATLDDRYAQVRRTEGATFTALEPLQNWIDLLASGIDPQEVKVLGINGGEIAAVEYRIALALGASVGVIQETGREAANLLADPEWADAKGLVAMPEDPQTARAFVGTGVPRLDPDQRETIARITHERHREETASSYAAEEPSLQDWDELAQMFKESNYLQADHIFEKLRQIGCTVAPVGKRKVRLMAFTDEQVEVMAQMEHGRWNAERLSTGWRWGERKDAANKISPYLVSWSELPEEVREWDRKAVRRIPELLAAVGLEIRPE